MGRPYIPEMNHWYAFKVLTVDARDQEDKRMTVIKATNKAAAKETLEFVLGQEALRVKHYYSIASFDSESGAEWQIDQWEAANGKA